MSALSNLNLELVNVSQTCLGGGAEMHSPYARIKLCNPTTAAG